MVRYHAFLIAGLLLAMACGTSTPIPVSQKAQSSPLGTAEGADVELLGEAPCPRVNIAGPRYGHTVQPRRGQVGDLLRISCTTFRGEDWRWAPAQSMEVWWNLGYSTTAEGDSRLLAEFHPKRACRFQVTARVPPARPGTYPINVIVYYGDEFGPFLPVRFQVVP
jgi:hypothetical protein